MRRSDDLAAYVYDALSAGQARPEIREALASAGWTPDKIDAALESWADGQGGVPDPGKSASWLRPPAGG